MCMCMCARACVHACVRAYVRASSECMLMRVSALASEFRNGAVKVTGFGAWGGAVKVTGFGAWVRYVLDPCSLG